MEREIHKPSLKEKVIEKTSFLATTGGIGSTVLSTGLEVAEFIKQGYFETGLLYVQFGGITAAALGLTGIYLSEKRRIGRDFTFKEFMLENYDSDSEQLRLGLKREAKGKFTKLVK